MKKLNQDMSGGVRWYQKQNSCTSWNVILQFAGWPYTYIPGKIAGSWHLHWHCAWPLHTPKAQNTLCLPYWYEMTKSAALYMYMAVHVTIVTTTRNYNDSYHSLHSSWTWNIGWCVNIPREHALQQVFSCQISLHVPILVYCHQNLHPQFICN